jgi:hypothetical protein
MVIGKCRVPGVTGLGKKAEISEPVLPYHRPFFSKMRDGSGFPSPGVSGNEAQKNKVQDHKEKKEGGRSHGHCWLLARCHQVSI